MLQELRKLIECVLHGSHPRWRTQSRHSTQTGRQFDQCVTILRCFCLRLNSDDLKSVSSCSVSLAQRRHRSAKRFQTRLFSVCGASSAMTRHSLANFRNRSAACICGLPLSDVRQMHGILKLFRPNAAIDRSEIAQWPTRPKFHWEPSP